jgi:23S rRNA (cytosine1962-C5)-methyltransferase
MSDLKEELKVLIIKDKHDKRLRGGHMWIYSNEVDTKSTPLSGFSKGELVVVHSHGGKVIGTAFVNPDNLICGRLFSRKALPGITKSFLKKRIKQALDLRQQLYPEDCYRLVYGDSDGLPGLIVDRFYGILVVQINSAGWENHKDLLVEALQAATQVDGILLKNDGKMRKMEGLEEYVEVAYGDVPEWVPLTENGVKFEAPVFDGQKTGWFYDHRPNRAQVAKLAEGKRVLDVFSYIGGWGIQAAAAGAEEVICIDASEQALNAVERNARLNGLENVSTFQGDAFKAMHELNNEGHKFDIVIMDPPAFIAKRKDMKSGERAYEKYNQLAMRLLKPDGWLVSASCSMHLEQEKLVDILRSTSRKLDRQLQVIEFGNQGGDHPVHPAIPETKYIKSVLCKLNLSGY